MLMYMKVPIEFRFSAALTSIPLNAVFRSLHFFGISLRHLSRYPQFLSLDVRQNNTSSAILQFRDTRVL